MDNDELRGLLAKAPPGPFVEKVVAMKLDDATRLLADSEAYAKLRAEIAGAPVVPITRQVDFTGGIPISWDDHRFETTFAKLLPCDADGTLLRLPAGEGM